MSEQSSTSFSNKVVILSDLWMTYRNEPDFVDFMEYNDLSLPLSYAITNKIVESTPLAETFINETFELLLEALGLEDSLDWSSLEMMLGWIDEDKDS